jgi:hypothetical protein
MWWTKKIPDNIIDLFLKIYDKNICRNEEFNSVVRRIKELFLHTMDNSQELSLLIDKYLIPHELERKKNAEISTPISLRKEMLDKIPINRWCEYYKVEDNGDWTLVLPKVFEPCCGKGGFVIDIVGRLVNGLKEYIPDEKERYKTVLEKCLYFGDINPVNIFITRLLLDPYGEYNLNYYEGDTLKLDIKKEWGIDRFDMVIGNPPYNKGGVRSHTGKKLGKENKTIWPLFISYSLQRLKYNGILAFVTPLSWLKASHSLHTIMLGKYIKWMLLWDNIKSLSTIKAQIPISTFVLINKDNIKVHKKSCISTEVQSKKVKTQSLIYLNPKISIPLAYHDIFFKIDEFITKNNCRLEIKKLCLKINKKYPKILLPKQYNTSDNFSVDTYRVKDGIIVRKTDDIHPDKEKRKLIIANKSSYKGCFIDDGRLGLCGNDKFYILGENLELIQKILLFGISNKISHFMKYRQDFLEKDSFYYIPDLRKMGIDDITEEEFKKLIGI